MLKVFYIDRTDPYFSCLPEEYLKEKIRLEDGVLIQKYKSDKVRQEKLLGNFLLQTLLQREMGLNPREYRIERGTHGKPYIWGISCPVFFNLSHSGKYLVCALSDREVGIDVERVNLARMEVARRYFHPEEIKTLENLSADKEKQAALFFDYWTVKESYVKFLGTGLNYSLSAFQVKFIENQVEIWEEEGLVPLAVQACEIDATYRCFVCAPQTETLQLVRVEQL